MKINLYQRLINQARSTVADGKSRIQIQFRWILPMISCFIFLAAVESFLEGQPIVAAIMLGLAVFYGILYLIIRKYREKGAYFAGTAMYITAFVVILKVVIDGGAGGFAPIWVLVYPTLTMILFGRNLGSLASLTGWMELVFLFWTPWGQELLQYSYERSFRVRLPIVYLVLLAANFFSQTLRMVTVDELNRSNKRMEEVYRMQYDTLNDKIHEARRIRHDLRHHFSFVGTLLNDGKVEEAKAYIQKYYQSLPFEEALIYTKHYATNALLTYFVQRVKENEIACEIKVNFPQAIPMEVEDLTVILGNLLENAIEASERGKQKQDNFEAKIKVSGNYDGKMMLLSVENNTCEAAKTDHTGELLSSKRVGNGLGVNSVRKIVEKYGGILKITQKDGTFAVRAMINLQNYQSHQNR